MGARRRGSDLDQRRHRLEVAGLAVVLAAVASAALYRALEPGPWQRVYATREGLVGRRLACGDLIKPGEMFVALPHRSALHRNVVLRYRDRVAVVPVRDVGPWNIDDDYWTTGSRPAAERGKGAFRKPANAAGIDLSDATFAALGLKDNDYLEWRFVHRGYIPLPRLSLGGDEPATSAATASRD